MSVGIRAPGQFCWVNMLTSAPSKAQGFFGELFGWTYEEMTGVLGWAIHVDGRPIGGMFDLGHPNTPAGTPPHIGVAMKVESAAATVEKVTSLGGTARPPMDILDAGRIVACTDPNGARFDVWEPKKMPGTDVDSHRQGAAGWFETLTTDTARASKFYRGLFGWTAETLPMGDRKYTVFSHLGEPTAGMLAIDDAMCNVTPHWGTYFNVDDADRAVAQATRLGATLTMKMKEAPGVGRFCGFSSPQGVDFYLIQYS